MELCDCTLKKFFKRLDCCEELVKKLIGDVCRGLMKLHEKKMVHLNLKPSNIFSSFSQKFKIADFGVM